MDPEQNEGEHRRNVDQVVAMIRREMTRHPHERLSALLAQAEDRQRDAGGPGKSEPLTRQPFSRRAETGSLTVTPTSAARPAVRPGGDGPRLNTKAFRQKRQRPRTSRRPWWDRRGRGQNAWSCHR